MVTSARAAGAVSNGARERVVRLRWVEEVLRTSTSRDANLIARVAAGVRWCSPYNANIR